MKTLIYFFIALSLFLLSCGNQKSSTPDQKETIDSTALVKIEIPIEGMTCDGCAQTIQGKISDLPGINSVTATFKSKTAVVEYNPELVDTGSINNAIKEAGYFPIMSMEINNDSTINN